MGKLFFFTMIALLAIGSVSAQGWGNFGPSETVRVEGTLQLHQGHIALSTGTTVYFVPGIARYIGFVDGLREGARVTATGFAFGNVLEVTNFTIGGRDYDLGSRWDSGGYWGGGPMGRRGGWGDCCHYGWSGSRRGRRW